jgi:leucyl-tRNA synthetase
MAYDRRAIEEKWQARWGEDGLYKTTEEEGKPKAYVLDMFPYPSGEGLHVGHPKGYIATDIYSRKKRMEGFSVLHPMGWDAFGLPAENYALKNKTHPRKAVEENIAHFKSQLAHLGFDYDWSREINTTDPEYYRWTQWIFLKLFEQGLAYQSNEPINWCPSCMTGLANEDLDGTACERCGTEVVKKSLPQWVLKITEYADRMLEDLNGLQWPEHIKEAQRNWIGRSEGLIFTSPVKDMDLSIETFSAHFEAFKADTFVVIAPDHPLLPTLVKGLPDEQKVLATAKKMVEKRAAAGFQAEKEVEGVFTGRYTVDPVGNGELPIWVASYALADYGTGIVKCSAHDERDFVFAQKYRIPLKEVLEPLFIRDTGSDAVRKDEPMVERNVIAAIVKHWEEDKYLCLKWKKNDWIGFVTGGVEDGEDPVAAGVREIIEETGYKNPTFIRKIGGTTHSQFYHEIKQQNRFAHFTTLYYELANGERDEPSAEELAIHDIDWVSPHEMEQLLSRDNDMAYGWRKFTNPEFPWTDMEHGILNEPDEFKGRIAGKAREEIIAYCEAHGLAKRKTAYKIKDWVFSRQRYWGEPIPIIHCPKDGAVAVPYEDLPVKLPEVEHYEPTGTGESPLAAITDWVNTTCPKCGEAAKRETNTMPQWAGSSWYYLRFMDPKNDHELVSAKSEKQWAPVDVYVGGDHAVRHLIYARFWHKFLYDIAIVSTKEPFSRLEFLGFILAEDGRKMSKRFGNVINPDDVVAEYGADAFRAYEMFMGPFENTTAWSTASIAGTARFIDRLWNAQVLVAEQSVPELEPLLHQTIKKIGDDIEAFKFNTAVSQAMIFQNALEKAGSIGREQWSAFLRLLAPFAPHVTEELWEKLGETYSIHKAPWPTFDPARLVADTVEIVVQVNGKRRGSLTLAAGTPEAEATAAARALPAVVTALAGQELKRVVYVPNKIVNIVV